MACCSNKPGWTPPKPFEPALIGLCDLVRYEHGISRVIAVRNGTFASDEKWGPDGSPYKHWYRAAATRNANGKRLIAWKRNTDFEPDRLYFRALDSGRLLPMELADFRAQIYGHRSLWSYLDSKLGIQKSMDMFLSILMPNVLLLRNFHDMHAGDIPILMVNWTDDIIGRVLDYYVALSKPDHDGDALAHEFAELHHLISHTGLPCLTQTDILIRSLFKDPAADYLPPFVIVAPAMGSKHHIEGKGKARVLFRSPDCAPPLALVQSFPQLCGGVGCLDPTCAPFIWDKLYSLSSGSSLVRPHDHIQGDLCNVWGCNVSSGLIRCSRCKEVKYCSEQHQKYDWGIHKLVCEKP
ncbi:hypothetical protein AURDEDRAFT_69933 [Auricularia subglabra TFB-10046 SS5]|nr:hypothetical protein AURDEDRAFT_69933 [Auricularia subglabra TFB-10046 SS5]